MQDDRTARSSHPDGFTKSELRLGYMFERVDADDQVEQSIAIDQVARITMVERNAAGLEGNIVACKPRGER